MCFWDKEEVKLADIGEAERSFFIRQRPERKMRLQQRSPEAGWYILRTGRKTSDTSHRV